MDFIYLDNMATTKIDDEVLNEMLPYFNKCYGNPSSKYYTLAEEARLAVELARKRVSQLLNIYPHQVIFTSGATEANNFAIKGFCLANQDKGKHIITTAVEHKSVLNSIKELEDYFGFKVTYVKPDSTGLVSTQSIISEIRSDTIFVSVIFVNNELGTINDVEEIAKICAEKNIVFHTDATQAIGKIKCDFKKSFISLISMSGHKIYGPKGIGALIIKSNRIKLLPLLAGGGQELNLRSGTLNVPGIVGLGKAAEILTDIGEKEIDKSKLLSELICDYLSKNLEGIKFNGNLSNKIPNCISITIPGIKVEALLSKIGKSIALSPGSACGSHHSEPSHVLTAIGMDQQDIESTFRIGIGRYNTEEEIITAMEIIISACKELYSLNK